VTLATASRGHTGRATQRRPWWLELCAGPDCSWPGPIA